MILLSLTLGCAPRAGFVPPVAPSPQPEPAPAIHTPTPSEMQANLRTLLYETLVHEIGEDLGLTFPGEDDELFAVVEVRPALLDDAGDMVPTDEPALVDFAAFLCSPHLSDRPLVSTRADGSTLRVVPQCPGDHAFDEEVTSDAGEHYRKGDTRIRPPSIVAKVYRDADHFLNVRLSHTALVWDADRERYVPPETGGREVLGDLLPTSEPIATYLGPAPALDAPLPVAQASSDVMGPPVCRQDLEAAKAAAAKAGHHAWELAHGERSLVADTNAALTALARGERPGFFEAHDVLEPVCDRFGPPSYTAEGTTCIRAVCGPEPAPVVQLAVGAALSPLLHPAESAFACGDDAAQARERATRDALDALARTALDRGLGRSSERGVTCDAEALPSDGDEVCARAECIWGAG